MDVEKQEFSVAPPKAQDATLESCSGETNALGDNQPSEEQRVSAQKMFRIGLIVYVAWFAVHCIADIGYLLTIDARFPRGLGHLYPSEAERLASASYTRQMVLCSILHRAVIFGVVMALIVCNVFSRSDTALRSLWASIATWWESSRIRGWIASLSEYCCCCSVFFRFWNSLPFSTWCKDFKGHVMHGRLASELHSYFGFRLTGRELLHGSVYLTIFAAGFFLLHAPFDYWMQVINLKFGFTNSLMVTTSTLRQKMLEGFRAVVLTGIPLKFLFLCVLQYRLGWFIMWSLLLTLLCIVQYNIESIAPALFDMNNAFPSNAFAVGRGFPWVHSQNETAPWVSLNRVYFKEASVASAPARFFTNDKNNGQLMLSHSASGKWEISGLSPHDPSAPVYSRTTSAAAASALNALSSKTWTVGGQDARVGLRSGKRLRDKLYKFAQQRHIGIAQIYMVDGSHKDVRANAFVAGAGNNSVIGLFDTLFLGEHGPAFEGPSATGMLQELATGDSPLLRASEAVQAVDTDEEDQDRKRPQHSAPTQAMEDDEIVAILAHELAHAALKHLEIGMVMHAATSFVTFAALGWMAHSPIAAASLSLSAPLLHVGACAYDYVVGPPLEGVMSLLSKNSVRQNEYQADAYAARISKKYADALQHSLAKLAVSSNQDPDVPLYYDLLHFDHPSFARRWANIEAVKRETYQ